MKECPKCGAEMEIESCVKNTKKADISIQDFYWCPECGHEIIIKNN